MSGVFKVLPGLFAGGGILLFLNGIFGLYDANVFGGFIGGGGWTSERAVQLLIMHFGQLARGFGFAALVYFLGRILVRLEQSA